MNDWVTFHEKPAAGEIYMIAGWQQWADAGSVSSGLPQYLITHTGAHKIGEMSPDGFYVFQIPGTHHWLRPEVHFEEGYSRQIKRRANDFYYVDLDGKGLVIFLGDEPHMNIERYAEGFFYAIKTLGVRRAAIIGGVYGAMPYDKDREISCTYSLRRMKGELENYAVRFSNYQGGATIGSYLVDAAEAHEIELFVFNAFVPAYDFSQNSSAIQGVRIEHDYKAWYELMRRFNYMFGLGIDLSELDRQSEELIASIDSKIEELERTLPQVNVRGYLEKLASNFTERPFMPLDDVWERELGDLFDEDD
ncbi:MAG TPA: PAC2 family protein [Caldilineaceae bacterium]|nr:PAC2 family protein [Caldilineaceae bacterium]